MRARLSVALKSRNTRAQMRKKAQTKEQRQGAESGKMMGSRKAEKVIYRKPKNLSLTGHFS